MKTVRISRVGLAYPPQVLDQKDAARRIGEVSGDNRLVQAIARGTRIARRSITLPPDDIGRLGGIEERNHVYQQVVPGLAVEAARSVLGEADANGDLGHVVAISCTGYSVPGWDVELVQRLGLSVNTVRLPITQSGCAGGIVGIARAADYLSVHPDQKALVVAAELCSLAFHPKTEPGNLIATLIFGDAAGAALMQVADEGGLEIVDGLSVLVPCSREALGFALTDRGFYPVLTRELKDIVPEATHAAVTQLLEKQGLRPADIAFWLVHAGGARILSGLEDRFGMPSGSLRWSWQALRESGNTSSVSIFEVMSRYLEDETAPRGLGMAIAFGPGVSLEMLLVRRC